MAKRGLGLAEVGKGEVVIADCPETLVDERDRAVDVGNESLRLLDRAVALKNKNHAMMTLFWDKVSNINERTETARDRGMALGIRLKNGIPVIVELKAECNCIGCQIVDLAGLLGIKPPPEAGEEWKKGNGQE